jgi:hypothetical protein
MRSHLLVFPSRMRGGYLVLFEIVLRFGAAVQLRFHFFLSGVPCSLNFNTPTLTAHPVFLYLIAIGPAISTESVPT